MYKEDFRSQLCSFVWMLKQGKNVIIHFAVIVGRGGRE